MRPSPLLFLGGFDSAATMNHIANRAAALASSYPAAKIAALRSRLGSLDFQPPDIRLQPAAGAIMSRRG